MFRDVTIRGFSYGRCHRLYCAAFSCTVAVASHVAAVHGGEIFHKIRNACLHFPEWSCRVIGLLVMVAWWTLGTSAPSWSEAPGTIIRLRPQDLPLPDSVVQSAVNPPRIVERQNRLPDTKHGFRVSVFAGNFANPRNLIVAPSGGVVVAESRVGRIVYLSDVDGDGAADKSWEIASGLQRPFGMAFAEDGALLVADTQAIWKLTPPDDAQSTLWQREALTKPGTLWPSGGHWTRNLVLSPDEKYAFVSVGSKANLAREPLPRASILVVDLASGNAEVFASGLRNPVGLGFSPCGTLYTTVNERDGMGDNLVPDYLTGVRRGDFLGWPWAYIGPNPQPSFGHLRPELVATTKTPEVLFLSHSAPLGMVFYTPAKDSQHDFGPAYHGGVFVALHGSWNAERPRGYALVHVPFLDCRPRGHYEVFLSGFQIPNETRNLVWGRPVAVAVAKDGALLVADDAANIIWRVTPAKHPESSRKHQAQDS